MNKSYGLSISFVKDYISYYEFYFDYGNSNPTTIRIYENDDVFIDIPSVINQDDDEIIKSRKKDVLESILHEIYGEKLQKMVDFGMYDNVKESFSKVEGYIKNNNIKINSQDFSPNKNDIYKSICVYDEGLGIANFYIKNDLIDDEFGIKIYMDGSFYPIVSTKYINISDLEVKRREELIKIYIYEILKVRIDFEHEKNAKPLCIPTLTKRAISYCKKQGNVLYTDYDDNIYEYKTEEPKLVEISTNGKF